MRDPPLIQCVDSAITFYMQTYREREYAFRQALRLRSTYPGSRIVVRSDGGDCGHLPWNTLKVEFFDETRLFTAENGGEVVQRMLELFLAKPSEFLIKLDPDSLLHRRMHHLPLCEGLFGSLQEVDGCFSIQGGFIGMRCSAALAIAQSKTLLDPKLCNPDPSQGGYLAILHRRAVRVGLTSFDWTLGWAAALLNIPLYDFRDVSCAWKVPPQNHNEAFAFTHPDPDRPVVSA